MTATVLELSAQSLADPRHPRVSWLLRERVGVIYRAALDRDTCAHWTSAVYAARSAWTSNFDGEQFTLGRAFYTHLETGRDETYFDDATASDARVDAAVPGLRDRVFELLERLLGEPVVQRESWCGPGVHIFPAGGPCAMNGGDVHFDMEGLDEEPAATDGPAITAVLMLQPPRAGGALRLWARRFAGVYEDEHADPDLPFADASMRVGDVTVLECARLHQIQPFAGELDRVSITAHALRDEAGLWHVWF